MNIDKYISYQIESQFPRVYQEDGSELVNLVKSYYQFLENDIAGYYVTGYVASDTDATSVQYFSTRYDTKFQANAAADILKADSSYGDVKIVEVTNQSTYHSRRLFEYRDIDSTLSNMLLFYKNKFLNGLPFDDYTVRFAVKHILDLYRRKGTAEGIELFFRLFYGETVSIYHPAKNILKPSSSKWKVGRYVELYPQDPSALQGLSRVLVYGSVSGATATIDQVLFSIIGDTIVPVLHLSNVSGSFIGFDLLAANGNTIGMVRGSLEYVSISAGDIKDGSASNKVGDLVRISSDTGYGGIARVSSVIDNLSGEISFSIVDGGSGYAVPTTSIIVSQQTLISSNTSAQFVPLERIGQSGTGATGFIVGQGASSGTIGVGVFVTSSNTFTSNTSVFTIDRDDNISVGLEFVTPYNASASANIGPVLSNQQTVYLITDNISDFLNVPLNANNYSASPALAPMTGTSPVNLSTIIGAALVPAEFEIGTIAGLTNIDPGTGYVNDVFVLAKDEMISRFGLNNVFVDYDPLTSVSISVGDIVEQNDPSANTSNLNIKGLVKSKVGNRIEVMQLSLTGFSTANTMYVSGVPTGIGVLATSRNFQSSIMGLNAEIEGAARFSVGKISEVVVVDSGLGFGNNSPVTIVNTTKIQNAAAALESASNNPLTTPLELAALEQALQVAQSEVATTGIASAWGQGKSEGSWDSKTSHLNSKQVIQDSFFYQDFSYQVLFKLDPKQYTDSLLDVVHVAGTKVFHRFGLEERINTPVNISVEMSTIQVPL